MLQTSLRRSKACDLDDALGASMNSELRVVGTFFLIGFDRCDKSTVFDLERREEEG
jgi:hypothetical protein